MNFQETISTVGKVLVLYVVFTANAYFMFLKVDLWIACLFGGLTGGIAAFIITYKKKETEVISPIINSGTIRYCGNCKYCEIDLKNYPCYECHSDGSLSFRNKHKKLYEEHKLTPSYHPYFQEKGGIEK